MTSHDTPPNPTQWECPNPSRATYVNKRCRCYGCRRANARYIQDLRQRQGEQYYREHAPPGAPPPSRLHPSMGNLTQSEETSGESPTATKTTQSENP